MSTITDKKLAQLFLAGWCVEDLIKYYGVTLARVDRAIRAPLKNIGGTGGGRA